MTNRNMKLVIKSMRYIDYCYRNFSYEKQGMMTASFLEGSSQTNRNIKLIIKSMIDIDYYDSNYCYKKQVPRTVSFLESFISRGGSVLHAIKGKPVSFDVSKLKTENETSNF